IESPVFVTDSYRVLADSVRKSGNTASVVVTVEGVEPTTVRFNTNDWYLIDENGERWDQEGQDTGAISGYRMGGNGIEVVLGKKIRSKFVFRAKGVNTGTRFNLYAIEALPRSGRQIALEGLLLQ